MKGDLPDDLATPRRRSVWPAVAVGLVLLVLDLGLLVWALSF